MRRLAARLDLETEEVAILHGMLESSRGANEMGRFREPGS